MYSPAPGDTPGDINRSTSEKLTLIAVLGPNGFFVHLLMFFIIITVFGLFRMSKRKYEDNPDSTFTPLPTNITPLGIELDPETGVDLSNTETKKN